MNITNGDCDETYAFFLVAFVAQAAFAQESPIGLDVRFVGLAADYGTGVMSQATSLISGVIKGGWALRWH